MVEYQIVDLGFSPADGEGVAFQFSGGNIECTFTDWREQRVRFTVSDVIVFSWQEDNEAPDIRDDSTYEVRNSEIVSRYRSKGLIGQDEQYRHFKICFNAVGVLDVVCSRLTVP